ncbi:MAG: hypothetical protein C4524_13085 [Candidatus Zixiibacteriota bacterium]|nr:MAG: hypothetical protein C4524_13085 [candidate division Zixibacteria bacterium]
MYALRTTLILGAFWLLVFLAGGYQVHFRMKDQRNELHAKEATVHEELQANEELAASLGVVQAELARVTNLWTYRSKAIPRQESSHETYDYLDQILARDDSRMNFDYFAEPVVDSNGVRAASYKLIGEASFSDLYCFIWYLEHLPRYLRLNSLHLEEAKIEAEEGEITDHWVRFEMFLTAFSADRDGFDAVQYASDLSEPPQGYDPFKPPVKPVITVPENDLGLPNVFQSSLKALAGNQIYLMDQFNELKILNLGDEVYLGRLVDILPDENRAIFDLDQLIPPRQVSLAIKTVQ